MKQFEDVRSLLNFIVKVAKNDYCDGFYNPEPRYGDDGIEGYDMYPLVIKFRDSEVEFFGGEVPFCSMATAFKYKDICFRAMEDTITNYTKIAFAPDEDTLFDECWCIEIPYSITNFIYDTEKCI